MKLIIREILSVVEAKLSYKGIIVKRNIISYIIDINQAGCHYR